MEMELIRICRKSHRERGGILCIKNFKRSKKVTKFREMRDTVQKSMISVWETTTFIYRVHARDRLTAVFFGVRHSLSSW